MADDRVRGVYYDTEAKKILYWNGKEYAGTIPSIPEPPEDGTYTLKATDGVLEWVED